MTTVITKDWRAAAPAEWSRSVLEGVLVDLVRFELTTSSMPWKRAPNCATGPYPSTYITPGARDELTCRFARCLQ